MQDDRDILELLKAELSFLEQGGYRKGPRYPWRPTFMFEDSPTCINFQGEEHPRPCGECALIQFVPQEVALSLPPHPIDQPGRMREFLL
jgi:hypothetical protein